MSVFISILWHSMAAGTEYIQITNRKGGGGKNAWTKRINAAVLCYCWRAHACMRRPPEVWKARRQAIWTPKLGIKSPILEGNLHHMSLVFTRLYSLYKPILSFFAEFRFILRNCMMIVVLYIYHVTPPIWLSYFNIIFSIWI